jgi:hypothetical protein
MKKLSIVLLLLLLITTTLQAQDANALSDAERDFMLCVRHAAVRLEPSGEPASDIATGAVWSCATEEVKMANLLLHSQNPGTTPVEMRASAEYAGRAQVEWARLCRKTKDCALSP